MPARKPKREPKTKLGEKWRKSKVGKIWQKRKEYKKEVAPIKRRIEILSERVKQDEDNIEIVKRNPPDTRYTLESYPKSKMLELLRQHIDAWKEDKKKVERQLAAIKKKYGYK